MEKTGTHEALQALPSAFQRRIEELPETAMVCMSKRFQVPDGWVIVGETVLHEAPGTWPNGWMIKKPEETEIVCSVSPIPEPYVKIEHVGSNACPGPWPNAWKIERQVSSTDE
jgi:hypothetical protein